MVPVVRQPGEVVQQVGALPPADWPLGDVVRPDVGRHGGGGLAVAVGKRKKHDSLLQGKSFHHSMIYWPNEGSLL